MKKQLLFSLFIFISTTLLAQNKYIVFFNNKGALTDYTPEQLLGSKSIERRQLAQISFNEYDLPVLENNIKLLTDNNVYVIRTSKWLNAALVIATLSSNEILSLSNNIKKVVFVAQIANTKQNNDASKIGHQLLTVNRLEKSSINYGRATPQNELFHISYLHDKGFTGKGVNVAFLDVGYRGMDVIPYFNDVRNNKRILDQRDLWNESDSVYGIDGHGMSCASILVSNQPGDFVGMAPDVNLMLYITEDLYTETYADEFLYVCGLERADSAGAEIISASLGYKKMDQVELSHNFSDMDGKTAISTIGCNVGVSKGLLIVNSLGNSGTLCVPSDAPGVLAVGGATLSKEYDDISSFGPSYDKRIKPDVAAPTVNIYTSQIDGTLQLMPYGGTSSATPFITGLAACLKQAYPQLNAQQIITAIKQSGHIANNPNNKIGYGVPDAQRADSIIKATMVGVKTIKPNINLSVYPNPTTNNIAITCSAIINKIELYMVTGAMVLTKTINEFDTQLSIEDLTKGIYFLKIYSNNSIINQKIVKQ